jgi:PilZ domain
MSSERRRAPRYQFIADAEVTELRSGAKSKVKTGDLSIGGCFLRMSSPPAEGVEVRVTIFRASDAFTALGRVVFVFPNTGMGIIFSDMESNPLATLEAWLSELEHSRCSEMAIGSGVGSDRRANS